MFGFDFGSPGINVPGFFYNGIPVFSDLPPSAKPGQGQSGQQTVNVSPDNPDWLNIAVLGLDGFKSWLGFDLAQQQVAKGQLPSQNAWGNITGNIGGGFGSLILYGAVILVFVIIVKAAMGK